MGCDAGLEPSLDFARRLDTRGSSGLIGLDDRTSQELFAFWTHTGTTSVWVRSGIATDNLRHTTESGSSLSPSPERDTRAMRQVYDFDLEEAAMATSHQHQGHGNLRTCIHIPVPPVRGNLPTWFLPTWFPFSRQHPDGIWAQRTGCIEKGAPGGPHAAPRIASW